MIYRFSLFIFLLFSLSLSSWGQVQSFIHVPAPPEIDNLEIFCTYQDSKGLIWVGTNGGLFSYDGYTFKHFENPIEGEFSISTIQEVEGKLWLGAWRDSGLWIFDPITGAFQNAKNIPGFASFFANLFCVRKITLENNAVWLIATLHHRRKSVLVKFDLLNRQFNQYFFQNPPHIDHLEFNSFVKTNVNGKEIVWIATHTNGLYEFDLRAQKLTTHLPASDRKNSLTHYDIRYVYASPSEPFLWIGTKEGLNKMNLYTGQISEQYTHNPGNPKSLTNDQVWTILEVNRKLWVATENGLNSINLDTREVKQFRHRAKDPESIQSGYIRGLYQCHGLLWITSFGAGISQFDLRPSNFVRFPVSSDDPNGLVGSSITALSPGKDPLGTGMWVGTENGLFFFDKKSQKLRKHVVTTDNPVAFHSILSIENNLWVETKKGFKKYDISSKTLTNTPFAKSTNDSLDHTTWFTNSFSQDPAGMWMGSWDQGLSYLQVRTGKLKSYPSASLSPASRNSNTHAMFPTPVEFRGKKYIFFISSLPYISANVQTVRHCLVRLEPEKDEYTYYTQDSKNPHSLASNYIMSIHNSGDSVLWIGTQKDGLEKFDIATGRFTHIGAKQGITSKSIFHVITDNYGNVWMGTDQGISKMNVKTGQITDFRGNNLEGNAWMVVAKDESGNIYFGTNHGLTVFNPDSVRVNPYPPSTTITTFKVFDKELFPTQSLHQKHIDLTYKQNFFSFEFAALNYREPERNTYAYQLIGVDKTWNYSGNRRYVSYASLDPGSYEFRVKSCNNDGIWNPQWTSVYITIVPPWWATWWFRIGAGLGFIGIIFLLYRLRIQALKARQTQLEREVLLRTSKISSQKEEITLQQEQLTHMNEYLKLLSETLEDRVHDRTAELLKANEELRAKNEEIQQALVKGQTLERKRVAAELHDNLGGLLSAVKLNMEIMNAENLSEAERQLYENVLTMVTNACIEVRNISHNMLPEVLEKHGLTTALQRYAHSINNSQKIKLELDLFGLEDRLDKQIEASIYPICVELVNNILKHAQATSATLQIIHSQNEISIMAQDNGKGINTDEIKDGMGLQNIQSRIEAMQGTYRFDSTPGQGTTISIEIPLRQRKGKSINMN